jgi:hypothetical protein
MANVDLTAARLREVLHYDQITGLFVWKISRGGRKAGQSTGAVNSHGYLSIGIDGGLYKAHRLAILYMTGEWPSLDVDHIDGNRTNNRFGNLREASKAVNSENRHRSRAGRPVHLMGISRHKNRRQWQAAITVRGVKTYLGLFDTADEAGAAYLAAKRKLHEGCAI